MPDGTFRADAALDCLLSKRSALKRMVSLNEVGEVTRPEDDGCSYTCHPGTPTRARAEARGCGRRLQAKPVSDPSVGGGDEMGLRAERPPGLHFRA